MQYSTNVYLPVRALCTMSSHMRQEARHEANCLRNPAYGRLRTPTFAWDTSVTRDETEGELR
jgi:hypothetical protein